MPIYEYNCNSCGKTFSVLRLTHSENTECPSCGSADLRKLMSTFGSLCSTGSKFGLGGG